MSDYKLVPKSIVDELAQFIRKVDVKALVKALEWLRGAINATPENNKVQAGIWISSEHPRIKQIDAILAAYRNNGRYQQQ